MVSDQMFQRKPGSDDRVMSASADHLWCAFGIRFRTKREQLKGLSPESQGQNQALTVLYFPYLPYKTVIVAAEGRVGRSSHVRECRPPVVRFGGPLPNEEGTT